ncbi:hypothetical protein MKY84_01460 [Chryseomicrobium sp. FSL W7-1435]|uniref:hypothetical protein n=1 Tax=Chryseomicrobium sp. FSL W7-1435 TaxID=2921704 RepID=UPI00315A6006
MNDNHITPDSELNTFPAHRMTEETQHRLHQNIMKALEEPVAPPKRSRTNWSKARTSLVAIAALFILTILSINLLNTPSNTAVEEPVLPAEQPGDLVPSTAPEEQPEETPFDPAALEQQAHEILEALNNRDMEILASNVHSQKGIQFSPYYSVSDSTVTFQQNEVSVLLSDSETYLWGYGEANTEIRLTPAGYFEEYLQVERFFEADEVFVDAPNTELDPSNYLKSVFPDAKIVEFYHAGTEQYSGLDYRSLNLVFEQDNATSDWKLVAIIDNLFTP